MKTVAYGWMQWVNGSSSRHPVVVSGNTCWGIGPGGGMQWIFSIPDGKGIPTGSRKDVRMHYTVNPNMPQAWDMDEKDELARKGREVIGKPGEYTFEAWNDYFGWVVAVIHLFCE